jgi:hypothetical protein
MQAQRAVAHHPGISRTAWVGAMTALLIVGLGLPTAAVEPAGEGAEGADGDPTDVTAAAETEEVEAAEMEDETKQDDGSEDGALDDERGDRGDRGDHGVSAQDSDGGHVGERTVVWAGLGGEHATVACPDGTGTWHFVLTPSGGITITDATLTVGFGTDTVVVSGQRSGAQDRGAWHFHVDRAGGGTVTAASAAITHEGVPAGQATPLLTISDSWCLPGEVDEAAGDLVVVKDSRGWSPNHPDFEFALRCVLDGTTIIDETFALTDHESWSYAALRGPIGAAWDGATCTLTETDDHGAASVRMRDGSTWLDVVDNTATFTLRTGGTETQTITVRNDRRPRPQPDAGDLVVVKDSRGWSPNHPDFEFALRCVLDGTTIIDETFALTDHESWSYAALRGPIGAAWDGATCTLTETDDHGAASVRMRDGSTWLDVVDNTATFTLRTGGTETQTITVRNDRGEALPREEGDVVVVKEAEGWADDPAFGFSLVCILDGTTVISETFTLTAGASWSYADIHGGIGAAWDGATCTLTETEDHGATTIRMRVGDTELVVVDNATTFTLTTGGTATQTITVHDERVEVLPRREGDLVVVKEAEGWDDDPAFGFGLACVLDGTTVISETFTLTAGSSWSYADVHGGIGAAWDGASCTLTETEAHGGTTIGMRDGTTPLTVTNGAATFLLQTGGEQVQTVTVRNERVPVVPPTPPVTPPTPPVTPPAPPVTPPAPPVTPPAPPVTPPAPPVTPPAPPVPTQVLPQVLQRAGQLPVGGADAMRLSLLAAGLLAAGAAALRSTRRPLPEQAAGNATAGGTPNA